MSQTTKVVPHVLLQLIPEHGRTEHLIWGASRVAPLRHNQENLIKSAGSKKKALEPAEEDEDLQDMMDDPDRIAAEDELLRKLLEGQVWLDFQLRELDHELALRMQGLYRKIVNAAQTTAQAQGYELVLVDDSIGELHVDRNSREPAQLQILQQIARRRVIYASETVDITDELITRMNNAYRAGQ